MKPTWHSGPWTQQQTRDLQDQLLEAQITRSLTREERDWLLATDIPETLLESQE